MSNPQSLIVQVSAIRLGQRLCGVFEPTAVVQLLVQPHLGGRPQQFSIHDIHVLETNCKIAPRNQSDVVCDVSWIWLTSALLNLQLAPNYIEKTCWIHWNPLRSALSTQRWRRRRSATLTLVVQAAAEHGPHVPRSGPSQGPWTLETHQKHNRAKVFDRSLLQYHSFIYNIPNCT